MKVSYWIADGHVWIARGGHAVPVPFEDWNVIIERVGQRHPEADRDNPP